MPKLPKLNGHRNKSRLQHNKLPGLFPTTCFHLPKTQQSIECWLISFQEPGVPSEEAAPSLKAWQVYHYIVANSIIMKDFVGLLIGVQQTLLLLHKGLIERKRTSCLVPPFRWHHRRAGVIGVELCVYGSHSPLQILEWFFLRWQPLKRHFPQIAHVLVF